MLYFLSFMFWSSVIVAAYLYAGRAPALASVMLRSVIALGVLLGAPAEFLVWMAIWVLGLTVYYAGEQGRYKLAWPVALALFATTLILSRIVGAGEGLVSSTYQHSLSYAKSVLVGAGFSCFARAFYSRAAAKVRPTGTEAESLVFFFHFPVMMLVAGIAADVFGFPLMQQPNAAAFGMFAFVIAACVGAGLLIAHAVRRIYKQPSRAADDAARTAAQPRLCFLVSQQAWSARLVIVPVMNIRIMRMGVGERRVDMRMRVRFLAIPIEIVFMLVVAVVAVFMCVGQRRMCVLVFVRFSQVQPNAATHQRRSNRKQGPGRIAQHHE